MDGSQRFGGQAELQVDGVRDRLSRLIAARGVVVRGAQRGRQLGFPTANVETAWLDLPSDGVYAGWYERPNGECWGCAVNVGRRPTFYENASSTLEAHLLGFDGDLYGETATVRLAWFLREERAFAGVDELVAQLRADVALAHHLVSTAGDAPASSMSEGRQR